jgi:hypothetical protein
VWNVISYDLTSPTDLKETEGWKFIVVLSECSLYLVEFLKNGGQLRVGGGLDIDEVKL